MFKKGQSGNPAGRPPGIKSKNYATVNYWLEKADQLSQTWSSEKRWEIIKHVLDLMFPKVNAIPTTPDESVRNVIGDLEPKVETEIGFDGRQKILR